MKNDYKKYLWLLPASYVSFEFGSKLFEVLSDNQEFVDIISVIRPLSGIAGYLSYIVGFFDFTVAIVLLTLFLSKRYKKYYPYLFTWVILWPFVPASVRYFGGVAPFEIAQVVSISIAGIIAYSLYENYNALKNKI